MPADWQAGRLYTIIFNNRNEHVAKHIKMILFEQTSQFVRRTPLEEGEYHV